MGTSSSISDIAGDTECMTTSFKGCNPKKLQFKTLNG